MARPTEAEAPNGQPELQRVVALLGGTRVLGRSLKDPLDAHEILLRGLPAQALTHLMDTLVILRPSASLDKAAGMSVRTFQRRKERPEKPLSPEQSERTWKFAEILARATDVLGSHDKAEQWLEGPAIGLDGRRPIELPATPAGVELVE